MSEEKVTVWLHRDIEGEHEESPDCWCDPVPIDEDVTDEEFKIAQEKTLGAS